ncbi:uncharacterized protein TNCV_1404881 [Trichonephila clavipes]|nr:uncharacterized protein TNCV_1404881 [Trichonephila clavipes]
MMQYCITLLLKTGQFLGHKVVVVVSFPEGKEGMLPEPVRQIGLLDDRWRHHRSPPPQFKHGTGGEGNVIQPSVLVVSAATTHNTFEPTDLTGTNSVCTRRVFCGTGHRTQAFRSAVRCFNHWLPTALTKLLLTVYISC